MDSAAAATLLDSYAVARGVGRGFALIAISRCCLEGVLPLFEHIGDATV